MCDLVGKDTRWAVALTIFDWSNSRENKLKEL